MLGRKGGAAVSARDEEVEVPTDVTAATAAIVDAVRVEVRALGLLERQVAYGPPPVAAPECERQVVAALLEGYGQLAHVERLEREHFASPLMGWLFEVLRGARADGVALSDESLARAFDTQGFIGKENMLKALRGLRRGVAAKVGVALDDAATRVRHAYCIRRLHAALGALEASEKHASHTGHALDAHDALDRVEQVVAMVRELVDGPQAPAEERADRQ